MEVASLEIGRREGVSPFLKWPGGKRWLTSLLVPLLRQRLVGRYFEPFLGSGAMFLALQPKDALLSDLNEELVHALRVIADSPEEVVDAVWRLSNTAECYYRMRSAEPRSAVGKAARFLYLNRTAWGGIYRLNRAGEFNTPFGNSGRVICRLKPVLDAADHFSRADLEAIDFETSMAMAADGDVVYADPPYTGPSSGHESFMRYTPYRFDWADQQRLASAAQGAYERGASIVVSGRAEFGIDALYPGWHALSLSRSCRVSRRVESRSSFNEILLLSPNFDSASSLRDETGEP